jgi:hypothetical protein
LYLCSVSANKSDYQSKPHVQSLTHDNIKPNIDCYITVGGERKGGGEEEGKKGLQVTMEISATLIGSPDRMKPYL